MRAKISAFATATARMTWGRPWPSQATIPMASRMPGIARNTSMTRISTPSTLPPAAPAAAPTMPPMMSAHDDGRGRREADPRAVEDAAELIPALLVGPSGAQRSAARARSEPARSVRTAPAPGPGWRRREQDDDQPSIAGGCGAAGATRRARGRGWRGARRRWSRRLARPSAVPDPRIDDRVQDVDDRGSPRGRSWRRSGSCSG